MAARSLVSSEFPGSDENGRWSTGVGQSMGHETIKTLYICSLNILTIWGERGWLFTGWEGSVEEERQKQQPRRQYRDISSGDVCSGHLK